MKTIILLVCKLFFAAILILSCKSNTEQKSQVSKLIDKHTGTETTYLPDITDTYPGCKYKGNYIYAAAVNLAWNDIKRILQVKI